MVLTRVFGLVGRQTYSCSRRTASRGFASQLAPACETLQVPDEVVPTARAIELVPTPDIGDKAIAGRDLAAGTLINVFQVPVLPHPTMHTVMLDHTIHVAPTMGAEFISHACGSQVNTKVIVSDDRQVGAFVVTRDVSKGQDLTFNYNTTEWDMSCPFECRCERCSSRNTTSLVRGFKYLTVEDRAEIMHLVSPAVHDLAIQEAKERLDMLQSNSPIQMESEQLVERLEAISVA